MTDERTLVPFESTTLRGERMLVLAPHPDDEIIGCGGLIALHAREQRKVKVVVVTDGTEADDASDDKDTYREQREEESRQGLAILGAGEPDFLRFADRSLASSDGLVEALSSLLARERPDLLLVPHPLEIHPDHVALARAVIDAIQSREDLRGPLATTKVAFYEVSQPLLPNTLVDISGVVESKRNAIGEHTTQTSTRNYLTVMEGLNQFRTLTLDGATHAEGYFVTTADALRVTSWGALCHEVSAGRNREAIETSEALPITVVIRTKNRLDWLVEAVESVIGTDYPASVVVVNDGGASPANRLAPISSEIEVVEHSRSEGRSEAMNAGVRHADTEWIAFLDDDDLYYTDHLSTLANAARATTARGVYSDAVSVYYETGDDGKIQPVSRLRLYSHDFDADLLLVDNYIPLPTLLVRREDFLGVGGFDRRFDLFEDWDFLIRLTADGPLLRVPRVTCEIRHLPASGSAVQAAPEGSKEFREAKLKVWQMHSDRLTNDVFANALEAQKRRIAAVVGSGIEHEGRARHLETDVERLHREKGLLIDEVRREHEDYAAASTEKGRLQHELEQTLERLSTESAARASAEAELNRHIGLLQAKIGECQALEQLLTEHRNAVASQTESIESLVSEIERLNGVIEEMEGTKAWRLHRFAEKVRGR